MKYLVHTQVVIIFILVVLGILCMYLLYLFIDSKRRPVELSVTADEVTRFNVIKYILHLWWNLIHFLKADNVTKNAFET